MLRRGKEVFPEALYNHTLLLGLFDAIRAMPDSVGGQPDQGHADRDMPKHSSTSATLLRIIQTGEPTFKGTLPVKFIR